MLEKIRNFIDRLRAIWGLKKTYRKEIEIEKITKDWITVCIIERKQEGRRKELLESQARLKERELFLTYLNTLK